MIIKKYQGKMKDECGGTAIYEFVGKNKRCIQFSM